MSMSEEEYRQQAEALWRDYDEQQRWIEKRCRKAEADWRASHPWLAPDFGGFHSRSLGSALCGGERGLERQPDLLEGSKN
jgi:hypothetical protein